MEIYAYEEAFTGENVAYGFPLANQKTHTQFDITWQNQIFLSEGFGSTFEYF